MHQATQPPEPLKPESEPVQAPLASPVPTPQGTADTSQNSAAPLTNSFHPTLSISTSEPKSAHPGIQIGASLDGYVLLEHIGRGGMGIVFKARQPNSEQIVALKMIRDGIFADQESHDRFLQEVRAMGRLQSAKNIVPIYHAGQYLSYFFYVMPFLAGGSLSKQRKRYTNDPHKAVALVEKVVRAVHQLHLNQILHRDIKPSNILLDANDEPYLSDFGLAKLLDQDQSLTGSQQRLGTPAYMAPEQTGLLPTPMSPQTDIWALGVLLYELVTGTRPFVAPDAEISTTLLWKIVNETPSRPRKLRPDLDLGLEAVILKCLEKQPADRYASAQELADELERWLAGKPLRTVPQRGIHRVRRFVGSHPVWSVAIAAAFLIIGSAVLAVAMHDWRNRPDQPIEEMQRDLRAGKRHTLIGEKSRPSWSKWRRGDIVQLSTDEDGYFVVSAGDEGMLELARDIPTDRYRLKGKIRHDTSGFFGGVGIFIGHSTSTFKEFRYEVYFQIVYTDIVSSNRMQRPPGFPAELFIPNVVAFTPVIRYESDHFPPRLLPISVSSVAIFHSAQFGAKKWRDLQITVTPDSVVAQFDDFPEKQFLLKEVIQDLERDKLELVAEDPNRHQALQHLETSFHHQGSLGIIVRDGAAAFSNFVLEPLP